MKGMTNGMDSPGYKFCTGVLGGNHEIRKNSLRGVGRGEAIAWFAR